MQSSLGLAADSKQICMDIETAARLGAELDNCERVAEFNGSVIDNLKQNQVDLFTLSDKYKEKCDLLAQDKVLEKQRGDKFEQVFTECSKDLMKCEDSKPSRLTWFGSGVISTLVLTLFTVIAF